MKTNCRHWPCRNIATDGHFCKDHQPERPSYLDDKRENSYRRGYGRPWRNLRIQKLKLNPICEMCYRAGHIKQTEEVDHIVPIRFGGRNELENLQSLCIVCHRRKTQEDYEKYDYKK